MAGQEQQLGKYTLLERIGVGGMAEVWLARARGPGGFNKACVVKTVRNGVDEERFRRMFMDEARLAAVLNHPNIVQIFDFGEDNGRLFIAMEFILGRTLRSLLKKLQARSQPFPLEHVARVMGGVLEGLQYAHNLTDKHGDPLRIIHRDVSPDNVMISYSGVPKLVDFGIAKATLSTDRTRAGRAKGKLLYMAPEQLTGSELDHRVDVYAAAVVLFEMCCGAHPFPITSPEQLAIAIVEQEPPHPQDVNPALPDELADIILRCLRKNPAGRLASARAMLEHLEGFVQSLTISPAAVRLDQLLGTLWADEMAEDAHRARRASDAAASIPPPPGRETSLLADDAPDTVSDVAPRDAIRPPLRPAPPRPAETPREFSHAPLPQLPPGETVLSTDDRAALERVFNSGLDVAETREPACAGTATHHGAAPAAPVAAPAAPAVLPGHWLVPRGVALAALAVGAVIAAAVTGTAAWVLGVRTGERRAAHALPAARRLAVATGPGCLVSVDGAAAQPGPRWERSVEAGPHQVEVRCAAGSQRATVEVLPGRDLEVVLRPAAEATAPAKPPGRPR